MKIQDIKAKLQQYNLDAVVITHGNRFLGQDILPREHKLQQICGFSGSAGIMAITANTAYLLVDGRYELQAQIETEASGVEVVGLNPRFKNVCDLLQKENIERIGYNPWNHSVAEMEFLKRRYQKIEFVDAANLLTEDGKHNAITALPREVAFSGLNTADKIKIVTDVLAEQNADYFLFTSADSVSWLLNIYAQDLPYTPIVRAYALVAKSGEVTLFADNLQAPFAVSNWRQLEEFLQQTGAKILYDSHSAPEKIKNLAGENLKLVKFSDVCALSKVIKNSTELQGMINCHIRDGVALVKLLAWLENNWQGLTEIDVVEKLHQFRQIQPYFFSESFATIAGSGTNGAIVHYQPTAKHNSPLMANSLLLLDSGAQYFDGTTDVTRTIALGTPCEEMISDFTQVLKAHIALATARFPQNVTGAKLDVLARAQIWHIGADYKHGTGHGVACFGNVHEGPISISASGSDFSFSAGMITSNEPGIYKEGKYGIRIENLQYTAALEGYDGFLQFKHLTKVPIDKKLIAKYMLSGDELAWLNAYHADVYASLAPYLDESEKIWLENACSPL